MSKSKKIVVRKEKSSLVLGELDIISRVESIRLIAREGDGGIGKTLLLKLNSLQKTP